jgi:hypothetical protein
MCNPLQLVATRVLQRSLSTLHSPLCPARPPISAARCVRAIHIKRKETKAEESRKRYLHRSTTSHPYSRLTAPTPCPCPPLPACMPAWIGTYVPTLPPSPIGADPIARPGSPTRIATSRHDMTSPGRQFRSGPPGTARRVEARRRLFGSEIGRCPGRGRHGLIAVLCCAMLCYTMLCCQRCWIFMLLMWGDLDM